MSDAFAYPIIVLCVIAFAWIAFTKLDPNKPTRKDDDDARP